MAKKHPASEPAPSDWKPTQAVPEPVVNSPYVEPQKRWVYQPGGGGTPYLADGRRPASYFFKTSKTTTTQETMFGDEQSDDLPLVNRLRVDVKRWRAAGYRGASAATKALLAYWTRADRHRRLFFCQIEAVETVIYLLEVALPGRLASTGFKNFDQGVSSENYLRLLRGERPRFVDELKATFPRLADAPADASLLPLRRFGCKMATGSGKTIVMAMLIAWAFVNRGRNPATTTFPSAVLVCAPNLTVRKRLSVLLPSDPGNYYDFFDLVPAKYRELLGVGRVVVTNWHKLALKNEHNEGGTSYRVVDKGEETPEAFAKDRLGDLAERLPILVLNDEGHHCWRPKPDERREDAGLTGEEKKALEEERDTARIWLDGLDRINNAGLLGGGTPCVAACIDLSATPFYIANSGYDVGSPFPWLVSDFGLVDAIESGIVKIPRLPVRDDTNATDEVGRPDPKYFRLWRKIDDELKPNERVANRRPKPEAVYKHAEGALGTLYGQWKKRFDQVAEASPGERPVPPVMIVVCDNTEIADVFFKKISGERTIDVPKEDGKGTVDKTVYDGSEKFPDLANTETERRTIRIDTKLLAKIETEEGETKDEAAEALRQLINTVGRRGEPGEQVRCVVSVSMLTEGWDATNVTHILGVRAFESQLLCEQVVGRGLRRMSYTADANGMLAPEYVDVYGIPFSLIPFKGKPKDDSKPDPVTHHVFALEERAKLEVRMPVVESYAYELRGAGIKCDVFKLEGLIIEKEPNATFVTSMRGYRDTPNAAGSGDEVKHTRETFYSQVRIQQVLFRLAREIVDDLAGGFAKHKNEAMEKALLARHQLFPEVLKIVEEYVATKVKFAKGVDARELALDMHSSKLRERLRSAIVPAVGQATLRPIVNSYNPVVTTEKVNFSTTRPVVKLVKSHLNAAVIRSELEKQAIEILEELDAVECFAPNDRQVGFQIPYEHEGAPHLYEPDFVVRVRGGTLVLVEIKGTGGEIHDADMVKAKNDGTEKWTKAVNNTGIHGRWAYEFCGDLTQLRAQIEKHATPLAESALPFKFVEPKSGDRWKTCVPLTTLKAVAGRWSEEQSSFDALAEWATDWVELGPETKVERGMFVARVQGDSMAPEIADGDYCLFRAPRGGSREGRRLLVWHAGVTDRHTGGTYTLKVYSSEKVASDEGWQHVRIVLKPLNPAYDPIVLSPKSEDELRVIAELAAVLGRSTRTGT